ncbi:hypothetical protein BDW69DRAFT_189323 [Aspergillus filifer]
MFGCSRNQAREDPDETDGEDDLSCDTSELSEDQSDYHVDNISDDESPDQRAVGLPQFFDAVPGRTKSLLLKLPLRTDAARSFVTALVSIRLSYIIVHYSTKKFHSPL